MVQIRALYRVIFWNIHKSLVNNKTENPSKDALDQSENCAKYKIVQNFAKYKTMQSASYFEPD